MKILSFKDFLIERENKEVLDSKLILEGGAAGHMSHPFDNKQLTFGDFKNIINLK